MTSGKKSIPRRNTRSASRANAAAQAAASAAERVQEHEEVSEPAQLEQVARNEAANSRAAISRAVADREASRLARPERRSKAGPLPHASKSKSAVTSTPSGVSQIGVLLGGRSTQQVANNDEPDAWCGPFSVARQMIAAREEAKAKREAELAARETDPNGQEHPLDAVVELVQLQKKRRMNPSMRWKPNIVTDAEESPIKSNSRDNLYVKRLKRLLRQQSSVIEDGEQSNGPVRRVKSLFQTCVDFLVENFENVESLGSAVDCSIRTKICQELVTKQKFTQEAFQALVEPGIEALELVDCANVTQDQLAEALRKCLPLGMTGLILQHAGRCFGPKTVQAIIDSIPSDHEAKPSFVPNPAFSASAALSSSLFSQHSLIALSIGGAYLLTDQDAARLIRHTSKSLNSIEFKACPLLGSEFLSALGLCYGDNADEKTDNLLLELSLQDINLTKDALKALACSGALRRIRNLKLQHLEELDDQAVQLILDSVSSAYDADQTCCIEGINLAHNVSLTDEILAPIRKCNRNGTLQSLVLTGLKCLTAIGLEALFTRDLEGLPNSPVLRRLDLGECAEDTVSDEIVRLAVSLSSRQLDSTGNVNSGEEQEKENAGDDMEGDGGEIKDVFSSPGTFGPVVDRGGMVYLNLNGAVHVTDKSMEHIAKYCVTSLHELDVSFCPNVTDQGLGYLVSQVLNLRKLCIWGCAQISDNFHDGHRRVMDSSFEVEGAWMKKSSYN